MRTPRPDVDRRTKELRSVMVSPTEWDFIGLAARKAEASVADFVRRAALDRAADLLRGKPA